MDPRPASGCCFWTAGGQTVPSGWEPHSFGHVGETGIRRDTEITVIHEYYVLIAYVITSWSLDEGIALVEGNVKARHIRGRTDQELRHCQCGFIGTVP